MGKRQCMGEALARNEVMLFSVGLIQRLSFLPPDSGDPREEGERLPRFSSPNFSQDEVE